MPESLAEERSMHPNLPFCMQTQEWRSHHHDLIDLIAAYRGISRHIAALSHFSHDKILIHYSFSQIYSRFFCPKLLESLSRSTSLKTQGTIRQWKAAEEWCLVVAGANYWYYCTQQQHRSAANAWKNKWVPDWSAPVPHLVGEHECAWPGASPNPILQEVEKSDQSKNCWKQGGETESSEVSPQIPQKLSKMHSCYMLL